MTRYTTGELAKLCGVTVRTVQFYDAKGLLKPSDLSEGGRRLYTDDDAQRLRIICFLKDLGFALKDIANLLDDDSPRSMLQFLIDEQERSLSVQLEKTKFQLDQLQELKAGLRFLSNPTAESIGAMAAVMGSRKKLRTMHLWMIAVGIVMDAAWIGGLVFGIVTGTWWLFAVGLAFAVAAGVAVSRHYYTHVAFICPEDHAIFRAPLKQTLFAAHTPRGGEMRKLTCPVCGYTGYCLGVYAPDAAPERLDDYLVWAKGGDVL